MCYTDTRTGESTSGPTAAGQDQVLPQGPAIALPPFQPIILSHEPAIPLHSSPSTHDPSTSETTPKLEGSETQNFSAPLEEEREEERATSQEERVSSQSELVAPSLAPIPPSSCHLRPTRSIPPQQPVILSQPHTPRAKPKTEANNTESLAQCGVADEVSQEPQADAHFVFAPAHQPTSHALEESPEGSQGHDSLKEEEGRSKETTDGVVPEDSQSNDFLSMDAMSHSGDRIMSASDPVAATIEAQDLASLSTSDKLCTEKSEDEVQKERIECNEGEARHSIIRPAARSMPNQALAAAIKAQRQNQHQQNSAKPRFPSHARWNPFGPEPTSRFFIGANTTMSGRWDSLWSEILDRACTRAGLLPRTTTDPCDGTRAGSHGSSSGSTRSRSSLRGANSVHEARNKLKSEASKVWGLLRSHASPEAVNRTLWDAAVRQETLARSKVPSSFFYPHTTRSHEASPPYPPQFPQQHHMEQRFRSSPKSGEVHRKRHTWDVIIPGRLDHARAMAAHRRHTWLLWRCSRKSRDSTGFKKK